MEIKIQSIHFDATEKLQEFIEKKVAKLEKTFEDIKTAEVQLKVVKPATAQNKETSLTVAVPGQTLFVEKTCDTFEEGVDLCVDAMKVQLPRLHHSRSAAERPDRAAPQAPCSFAALHRTIFVSLPLPPPECVEMCRFYLTVFRAVCQSFRQRFAPKFFSENWADSTILIVSGRERPLPAVLRVSSLTKSR